MSGGSYDYTYRRIDDLADDIREQGSCSAAPAPLRKAFKAHLKKVAEACRAIEWNDSCDGDDRETELLSDILSKADVLDAAIQQALATLGMLEATVAAVESMRTGTAK